MNKAPDGYNVHCEVAGIGLAVSCKNMAEVSQTVAKLCNAGFTVMVEPFWNVK